ncbi:MAG: phosphatidate cytidylyltransferase [Clostridia bacterium]|nr:phosphatidate cytidylyltransferase [Clostridia bacterium]
MKKRIITGIVALLVFIPICIFSKFVIFPIAMGILAAIGVFEISKCIGWEKKFVLTIPTFIVALALPILRYFLSGKSKPNSVFLLFAMASAFLLLVYTLAYVMFTKNKYKLSDALTFFALSIYVIGCFSSVVIVRYTNFVEDQGKYMYLIIFLSAWICDTFAYFTGRFFGKHKLIPAISPKKTIEGAIGGIIFTFIAMMGYGCLLKFAFKYDGISFVHLAILGVILPIVSQIGDLIASCIKRQYNIKDFGNVFPGHGGVIDRFDSPMLVAPVICLINAIVSLF